MKRYLYSLLAVLYMAGCAQNPYVIVQVSDAQLGPDMSAFRVITVENGAVSDEIVELK